jgi:hypothetical protein
MPKSATTMYNDVAKKTTDGLKPLKKALAVMKELQSWGPDEHGRSFEFEVYPSPQTGIPMVLASYGTAERRENPSDKKSLTILHMWNEPEKNAILFDCGKCRKPGRPHERALYNTEITYHDECAPDKADQPVKDFSRRYMIDHPRYKAAVAEATAKVVGKIKPSSPM